MQQSSSESVEPATDGAVPSNAGDAHRELDQRIMRSSAYAIVGFGGANALSFVTGIVLARLLTPADFGLMALTLSLLAITSIIQESGLHAALVVYRGDIRRAAASVLAFTPIIGLAVYVACFVAAPFLADFFSEPEFTDVFRVTSVIVVLQALMIMPGGLLERGMRFGWISAIELAQGIVQAAVAIALAVAGAGVWSLVGGQIAMACAGLVFVWAVSPLRPSPREARVSTLRELMRFGRHAGGANLLTYAGASAEGVVIGRQLGASALGVFSVAARFASVPSQVLGNIVGRGVFAAMAHLQDDLLGCRRLWLENLQRLFLVSVPAGIMLIFIAEPLVIGLIGEKWVLAVVPLQILAVNALVRTFPATSYEVFQARGRPAYRVVASVAHLALVIPALTVGARWDGLEGAAWSLVLVNVVVGVPVMLTMMSMLEVDFHALVVSLVRPALVSVAMAVALVIVTPLSDGLGPATQLLVLVLVAAVAYSAGVVLFAQEIVTTMWRSFRGAGSQSGRSSGPIGTRDT